MCLPMYLEDYPANAILWPRVEVCLFAYPWIPSASVVTDIVYVANKHRLNEWIIKKKKQQIQGVECSDIYL